VEPRYAQASLSETIYQVGPGHGRRPACVPGARMVWVGDGDVGKGPRAASGSRPGSPARSALSKTLRRSIRMAFREVIFTTALGSSARRGARTARRSRITATPTATRSGARPRS